jgi:selenocysteine lyase/cysteine desulfurase
MVDVAIAAMADQAALGGCGGGYFAASATCDDVQAGARAEVGALLGAPAEGVWFGPNMTTMTLAFTRALARDWRSGDRIVCTQLDHDANVTPWKLAAAPADRRRRRRLRCSRHLGLQVVWTARRGDVRRAIAPGVAGALQAARVGQRRPRRFETGMPSYEALAGVRAAARFLLDERMSDVAAAEERVFAPLLDGLLAIPGVRVWGPHDLKERVPTVSFTIDRWTPAEVAEALAAERIAVWSGHNYALGPVDALGLADAGGVVRAGVVRYVTNADVARLLDAVERLAASRI